MSFDPWMVNILEKPDEQMADNLEKDIQEILKT